MSKKHKEVSRFHQGGKTFFFNEGEARTGTRYLAIKALWGKGNAEQLVLFPGQMLEFYQHFMEAMEEITGLRPGDRRMVEECPACGSGPTSWRTLGNTEGDVWVIYCEECREVVFENVPNAWDDHLKEEYDGNGA